MTLDKSLDPIGFSIIWGRLVSIVDEAALTLGRTAFSPLITESNDFGVVLLDTDGYAVAQSSFSIPPFLGTIPEAVRSILKKFPQETWVEGDAALTNDPWYAGGHLLDITLLTPIFYEGRLVAFTGSTAHWADIGGTGFSTDTNDLFEEGLLIPPSKLYRGGHVEQDLLDLILQNTRVPDKVFGDLNAQIDAGTVCERRLGDLLREHDLSDLGTLAASIHDVGEQAMRRRIAELPDGRYCHEINIDGLGYAITISAAIDVKGDEMEIDLAGTTAQLPGAVNCPPGYTKALLFHALKCVLDPTTPNNDGCHRPITVHAPVGTVVNPRPPGGGERKASRGTHDVASRLRRAEAHTPRARDRRLRQHADGGRQVQQHGSQPAPLLVHLHGEWGHGRSRREGRACVCSLSDKPELWLGGDHGDRRAASSPPQGDHGRLGWRRKVPGRSGSGSGD